MNISLLDIIKAKEIMKSVAKETPFEFSPVLSESSKGEVFLKLENLQRTGSFKIRGAMNKISSLTKEEIKKGIVTASAGNHAQGVAYVSKMLGIHATIVIPESAPLTKIENTKRYGVEVVLKGKDYDDSERIAHEIEKDFGKTYVHAFNDPYIIAGQGTVGYEMLIEQPDLDMILVPAGGGGLISGIARAAKFINPSIKVIGIQPQTSPPWYAAHKNKKYVKVDMYDSLADGLTGDIYPDMVEDFNKYVDDVILVDEDAIGKALYWLIKHHHQIAEGSSVVGIAAILDKRINVEGKKVGVVVTGSNIDSEKIKHILNKYEGVI